MTAPSATVAAEKVHREQRLAHVALVAFVAMCLNDISGTCMVVFEAHYNPWLAGLFDMTGWILGLICSAPAIGEIVAHGYWTRKSLTIIGAVSAANFIGTFGGVGIAKALS